MKLAEFKTQLQIYTRGDIKAPETDELKILMREVAADIHRAVTPLEKIEIDIKNFEADYYINNMYFVREFKAPSSDEDKIDFLDKMLIKALIYGVAAKRCYDEKMSYRYKKLYLKALTDYEINNFDERSYDIEAALIAQGWMKPYTINYALDSNYVWDKDFISSLDFYIANIQKTKDLSYRKFVQLFIDYQNKNIPFDREDLKELDKIMKAKIQGG